MSEEITMKEVLELVTFEKADGKWGVQNVGDVFGNVRGIVLGNVGSVQGNVGHVRGKNGYKTS